MDLKNEIRNFRVDEDFKSIRGRLLGRGMLYEDANFFYRFDSKLAIDWLRPIAICRNPYFIDGRPSRFDCLQGSLGDCWLISAINALTLNDEMIKQVVPHDQSFNHDYIGAFHFRIWRLGTWYDVVVDDRLPTFREGKKVVYAHSSRGDIFWEALLEKAYAKTCAVDEILYDNLNSGLGKTSLQDLSGGIAETIKSPWYLGLNDLYKLNTFMVAFCCGEDIESLEGLTVAHTYAITRVFRGSDGSEYDGLLLVRLMNPRGQDEWKGDWSDDDDDSWRQLDRSLRDRLDLAKREDGEFWMEGDGFWKYFQQVWICHQSPVHFMKCRYSRSDKPWTTRTFTGEWVTGLSDGGQGLPSRHLNPQYIVRFEWQQGAPNQDEPGNVIIDLVARAKMRRKKVAIAIYIYPLENDTKTPLDEDYLKNNSPIDENPNFESSEGRSFVMSANLKPGLYCIMPCSGIHKFEFRYLLRIFSEFRVIPIYLNSDTISKAVPSDEIKVDRPVYGESLKTRFDKVTNDQQELDWRGLQEILNKQINSDNTSDYCFIAPFLEIILCAFRNFVSRRSSRNYDTEGVAFTKDECRSMIAMLDDNHSGTISLPELIVLWNKICFWMQVYETHKDRSTGQLTVVQLRDALSSMGYDVSKGATHSLSYLYVNEVGNIPLTDFIICGVTFETVLNHYKRDGGANSDGGFTFTLEDWIKKTLIL